MCLKSKYKSVSEIASKSGESRHAVYRLLSQSNKRRVKNEYVRKLKPEDHDEVIRIYNDNEVSYSLPDIKYAGLRFMFFTLSEVYAVYLRKLRGLLVVVGWCNTQVRLSLIYVWGNLLDLRYLGSL